MAVTVNRYNHTAKKFLNKEVDLTTMKAMLLTAAAVAAFTASHTTVDQAAGAASPTRAGEVFGNGWTESGELLTGVAVSIRSTNGAALSTDDLSKTATGGNIGPAYGVLLLDDTGDEPLWLVDFGQAEEAGEETEMLLVFDPTGTRGTILVIS